MLMMMLIDDDQTETNTELGMQKVIYLSTGLPWSLLDMRRQHHHQPYPPSSNFHSSPAVGSAVGSLAADDMCTDPYDESRRQCAVFSPARAPTETNKHSEAIRRSNRDTYTHRERERPLLEISDAMNC